MTTDTLILVKLNRVLHAIAHNDKASAFHCLIEMVEAIFPCDAAVLLSGSAEKLEIAAQKGLREESAQTTFFVQDHPRLEAILQGRDWVRFDADSPLPDPYDNLVDSIEGALPVHDCMGTPLFNIDGSRWGVLTFDTLIPHAFNDLDPNLLRVVTELASLCLSIETNIDALSKIQETNLNPIPHIIGNSTVMVNLQNNISAIAVTDLNVLIQGESGTGKELIAQQIHQKSHLRDKVLVTLNCATLPSELAESELFGHEKGAFTGADKAKRGKFELADNGTLFLDEIGELPLTLQAKLLRALQQGEIQRLGSETSIRINCRVIAATNRNLSDEVTKGRFREDLYHRLNVFPVQSPPLRERHGDIPLLIEFFTKQWQSKIGIDEVQYSDQAMQTLNDYSWPGNVRELENMVARILVTEQSRSNNKQVLYLNERSIPINAEQTDRALYKTVAISNEANPHNTDRDIEGTTLQEQTQGFQRKLIKEALSRNDNNWSKTAKQLGVDRANLARLAKRLMMR